MNKDQLKQLIKEEIQKEIKTVPNNNSALLKKMLEYNEEYGESIISSFFPYDTLEQWMEESEYDEDDKHHKDAMALLVKDILELTATRDYYLDRETLLKMYDMYMDYKPSTPMWEQNQQALYDKLKEQA